MSDKFTVIGNRIETNCLEGNKHYFVFANNNKRIKINERGIFKIKFKILEDVDWLAFGLCDKKFVENNNYKFVGKFSNNGYYFISINNVVWHCIDAKHRKKISCPKEIGKLGAKNNIIECDYVPSSKKILFYVNGIFFSELNEVCPIQSDFLLPCLVFLQNCAVKTDFDYPK